MKPLPRSQTFEAEMGQLQSPASRTSWSGTPTFCTLRCHQSATDRETNTHRRGRPNRSYGHSHTETPDAERERDAFGFDDEDYVVS